MRRKLAASLLAPILTAPILMTLALTATGIARAEGELHLYNWRNYTSPELIANFEEAHDVKVTLTEYDSMAEALNAIRTGGGGFDLMVPPADTVATLIDERLLLQTRPERMENFANVATPWRDPPWDPRRRYSVPWQWGGIGMVVDGEVYDGDIDTSAIIFDPPPELAGKINIAPERDEIIAMALLYIGVKPCTSNAAALEKLRGVLVAARAKWRSMDYGIADTLLRGDIAAAAYWSHAALRAQRAKPSIRFGYPREGFPLWMDSVVVLKDAANAENAKLFQNFIMAPENAALISAFAGHASGIDASEALVTDNVIDDPTGASETDAPAKTAAAGVFLPVCPEPVNALYAALWAELTK